MATELKNTCDWFLEGEVNNNKSLVIPINRTPYIIGRREDCNLKLSSNDISRKHAEIIIKASQVYIKDLNSTNGTFINDKKVIRQSVLNSGDIIKFANYKFRIFQKSYKPDTAETFANQKKNKSHSGSFIDFYEITKREEEILNHILQGKSTKKIAASLYISEGTAKNHILNIFKKTDVHSRFELLTLFNNFKAK